jgi:tetratricopeptide (TPR) repeat protein
MFETERGSALTGRPVVSLTFALTYAAGFVEASAHRTVNLAIHVLCALALYGLVRRTLARPSFAGGLDARATGLALASALLWVVHPLGSEAIGYITQRTESLMALWFVVTLYAAMRALDEGAHRGRWTTTAILACALGMASKETMVVAPLTVLLYDRAFAFQSYGEARRARWRLYPGLGACWALLALIVLTQSREFSGGYASTPVSSWLYLLNQTGVIAHYLRLTVWPDALVAFYGWAQPMSLGDVWPTAAVIVALVAGTVVLFWRAPHAGYLPLWFWITLAPASSLVPIAAEVGADRRMYLPLMALAVLAVVGAALARDRWAPRVPRAALAAVAVAVVIALGARTMVRNVDYRSELALSESVLRAWPTGAAHHAVGMSLVKVGRYAEAVPDLRAAALDYPPARYDLGATLFRLGRYDDAAAPLERFASEEPHLYAASAARTLLGRIDAARGRDDDAIRQFSQALSAPSSDPSAHGLLADLLVDRGAFDEAVAHYRQHADAFPDQIGALVSLGVALALSGRAGEAVDTLDRAVQRDPRHVAARENLARALLDRGDAARALIEAERAVALNPQSPAALDLVGQALAALGRFGDARVAFLRALEVDPTYRPARDNLARLPRRP